MRGAPAGDSCHESAHWLTKPDPSNVTHYPAVQSLRRFLRCPGKSRQCTPSGHGAHSISRTIRASRARKCTFLGGYAKTCKGQQHVAHKWRRHLRVDALRDSGIRVGSSRVICVGLVRYLCNMSLPNTGYAKTPFCLLSTPDRASNFIIRSFSCLGASLAYLFSLCQRPLLWGYASCMRHDAIYRDI